MSRRIPRNDEWTAERSDLPEPIVSRRQFVIGASALSTSACMPVIRDFRTTEDSIRRDRFPPSTDTGLPPAISPHQLGEVVPGLYLTDNFSRQVAFTFDDGPQARHTRAVLRVLARHRLKGVFFISGRLTRINPETLKRTVEAGHELGNHTWTHPGLSTLSDAQIRDEFDRTQEGVDKALGYHYPMRFYRPPYGDPFFSKRKNALEQQRRICRLIDEREGILMMWRIHGGDGRKGFTVESMLEYMKPQLYRDFGGPLVLHDTSQTTTDGLVAIIRHLRRRRFKFTTIDDLLTQKYRCTAQELVMLPTVERPSRKARRVVSSKPI